jgi:hypothetical protein
MWEDVEKNSAFEIPVANINVVNGVPNSSQWYGIPIFALNDKSKNPASSQAINQMQIATNSNKTKLYFYVELNGIIATSNYVFVLSNDYNCDGYYINFQINSFGSAPQYKYTTCGGSLTIVNTSNYVASINTYSKFEVSIDIPSELAGLKNSFMITLYSTSNTVYPSVPYTNAGSSTKPRWAKLK